MDQPKKPPKPKRKCLACEGSGRSSAGGKCYPCGGTGKMVRR